MNDVNGLEIGRATDGRGTSSDISSSVASSPTGSRNDKKKQLSWIDNPSVQRLLDVISSIIADEYIKVAKRNLEVFSPHPNPLPNGERELYGG